MCIIEFAIYITDEDLVVYCELIILIALLLTKW